MSTKDFEWSDEPDPTTWPWHWNGRAPGYLEIRVDDGAIAHVRAGELVRVFAHSQALGNTTEFWCGPEEGLLYQAPCESWAHGVRLIEDWLDTIGLWGTREQIRWTGLLEQRGEA